MWLKMYIKIVLPIPFSNVGKVSDGGKETSKKVKGR